MASQAEIQAHYDVGNDFYALFLDARHLAYSCGVWKSAQTLEQAQDHKLDRLCRYAHVAAGDAVLDIGCGWGGMLRYIVGRFPHSRAHGLTLSARQLEYIQASSVPGISAELCAWQDYAIPSRKFDAIVSIGAFEHFASLQDQAAQRHRDVYRRFFDWCLAASTPDAQIGLQTIVLARAPATLSEVRDSRYLLQKVFPGSALPSVSDIQAAIVDKYELAALQRIGADYAKTLAEWNSRLEGHRPAILSAYGEELFDHYRTYFSAAQRCFESGCTDLLQVSLKRAQQVRLPPVNKDRP